MATVLLNPSYDGRRDNGLFDKDILRLKTGLDDGRLDMVETSTWRCDSVCMDRTPAHDSSFPRLSWSHTDTRLNASKYALSAELLNFAANARSLDIDPPPPYSASVTDAPPCYQYSQLSPYHQKPAVKSLCQYQIQDYNISLWPELHTSSPPIHPMTPPAIDLNDTSTFRQVGNKKKKQAAKSTDWPDEGDGGGGDEWNFGGGGKKGKKNKKGKNAVDEEEEKRKKEEEEEKKRKEEEEEEEDAGGAGALDWMNEGDTKPDDDWGGFTSTDKKGKKNKKGKTEPAFGSQNNDFSDINLGETPKIDLSFGNDFGNQGQSTDFGFGGWGSSWDTTNAGNTNGIGSGTTGFTDGALGNNGDTGTWSFGSTKKSKKTTTTSGFDFGNLDTLEENKTTTGAAGQDDWATGFSTSGKKNKKANKKNALDDPSETNDIAAIGTAVTEPPAADDSWGTWGTKKDKNKKKKGETEEVPPVPPPPPAAPVEPLGKKDKKKGKKDAGDEQKLEEDPIAVLEDADLDPEPEADIGWGFSGKKSKKKSAKDVEAEKDPEPPVVVVPDQEADAGLGWGDFGTSKKDKKKGKKDTAELEKNKEPAITVVTEQEPETDLGWGSFGAKKEKKKGKKAVEEIEQKEDDIVAVVTDPDPIADGGWGAFGTKKTTKKGKGGTTTDIIEDTHVVQVPNPGPLAEDTFDLGWGTTTKKGKKDKKAGVTAVKEDPISVVDSSAATEATKVADDEWMNWGSDKKKDKKVKKGVTDEGKKITADEDLPPPPPPPPPVIPDFPEASSIEPWAAPATSKKDKKAKKGKTVEPEPATIEVPDLSADKKPEAEEDEWATSGLTASEKKKKEKTKLKEREKEEKEKKELEELEAKEREEQEKKDKEEKEKEKTKAGKKGKTSAANAVSKARDLMADSIPDTVPAVEENSWGSSMWGASKKDTKKKPLKTDGPFGVPPPVPTPPAQGLTPPPESTLDDLAEDDWGNFAPAKDKDKGKKDSKKLSKADESKAGKTSSKEKAEEDKKKAMEETPAKAARSFWGGTTTTAIPKSKTAKEEEAEQAVQEPEFDDELDLDEIVDIIDEDPPPKKGSKSKAADSKLGKSTSKDGKASKKAKADAEMDALIDLDDVDAKDSKTPAVDTSSKSKGEDKKADAFSFWGSSKKTSGKNGDDPKKEINKQKTTNQSEPLAFLSNEPEPSLFADEPAPSQSAKPSKSAMSTSKTSGKLSVAQKVKALEEERKKALEPPAPPPIPVEPEPEPEPPAKKAGKSKTATTTTAATTSKSTTAKKKEPSPPPDEYKKNSKDSVPGSFPAEGFEEENLIDMLASSPVEKKSAKKGAKTAKAPKKELIPDMMDIDEMPVVPSAPPTPPAEPTPAKPAKKERARVVRDEGASSWGFWGAAPKKDAKKATKAKEDTDVLPSKKTAPPALVRSKSTKTPKAKDKDTEKSSGSDAKEKKAESRPPKSRGSSFGAFFGGPPPARTKPVRRTSLSAASKTTSRPQSMDVDAFGLPSPPPEDSPAMTGKAAKLMGTTSGKLNRSTSTKGKQKAFAVPDPYPIDDDDMVMVNGIEDPIINASIPKTSGKSNKDKSSKSKAKRDAKPVFDAIDDIVMVDGPSQEEPELLAFDEKPRAPAPLQRSMTNSKKPANGKLMGLFGGFSKTRRNSETLDRPKGRAIVTDDEAISPRKRTVNSREESSKRIRRDDRKVRRSEKPTPNVDGPDPDAAHDRDPTTEVEDADGRRQERRAKREGREPEARQRSKRVEDEDIRRHDEKHSRRSGRDDPPVKESAERTKHSSSRPHKSDRRRSYMDPPQAGDRPRAHRSRTEQPSSKRRSVAGEDYFDPHHAVPEEGKNEPYMHGANDHTSSWVKSQLSDPADPPPVEGTVIEPTPKLGGKSGYDDDEGRKAARKARRQSRYGPEENTGEGDRERRHRRKEKESEGSVEWGGREREKLSRRYTDMGVVRDERPGLGAVGKRSSWLKKVTGMGA